MVGGLQPLFEVGGDQQKTDHYTAHHVSQDQLEESEISGVGEGWDPDEGEGAGLGSDDGEADDPPGKVAAGQEVLPQILTASAQQDAQEGRSQEVKHQDGVVQERKAHGGLWSYVPGPWSIGIIPNSGSEAGVSDPADRRSVHP